MKRADRIASISITARKAAGIEPRRYDGQGLNFREAKPKHAPGRNKPEGAKP